MCPWMLHDAPLDILKPPTGEIVSVRDLFWSLCDILGLWALGPSWCDASDYDMGNGKFQSFQPQTNTHIFMNRESLW